MTESVYSFCWLQLLLLLPWLGAAWVARERRPDRARTITLWITSAVLALSFLAWFEFQRADYRLLVERWDAVNLLTGRPAWGLDAISAPLAPACAFVFWLVALTTLKTKMRRFSFAALLVALGMLLALLTTQFALGWVLLAIAFQWLPLADYRARHRSPRVFCLYAVLGSFVLASGWALHVLSPADSAGSSAGEILVWLGVLLRCGVVPFHIWITDQFEHTSLGMALLSSAPLVGLYLMVRLVIPTAPAWMLQATIDWGLISALYTAGLALVQQDARRFCCFILLSQCSLLLVGLAHRTPLGLTAGLSGWLTVLLTMTAVGITLRSLESRLGRLSLNRYHGMYEHLAPLAVLFLLAGLATVGFPGTMGFVSLEMLVDGSATTSPYLAILVVCVTALNGIAFLQTYFRLFTGTRHRSTIDLGSRPAEWLGTWVVLGIILGLGLFPQAWVQSRYDAAQELTNAGQLVAPPVASRPDSIFHAETLR